jgi:hypothetical protein
VYIMVKYVEITIFFSFLLWKFVSVCYSVCDKYLKKILFFHEIWKI